VLEYIGLSEAYAAVFEVPKDPCSLRLCIAYHFRGRSTITKEGLKFYCLIWVERMALITIPSGSGMHRFVRFFFFFISGIEQHKQARSEVRVLTNFVVYYVYVTFRMYNYKQLYAVCFYGLQVSLAPSPLCRASIANYKRSHPTGYSMSIARYVAFC